MPRTMSDKALERLWRLEHGLPVPKARLVPVWNPFTLPSASLWDDLKSLWNFIRGKK